MIAWVEDWSATEGMRLLIVLAIGSTLIMAAAMVGRQCIHRLSAANRFSLWHMAFLSLGILPLGVMCLPEIPLNLVSTEFPALVEARNNADSQVTVDGTVSRRPGSTQPKNQTNHRPALSPAQGQNSGVDLNFHLVKFMVVLVWLIVAIWLLIGVLIRHLRTAVLSRSLAKANLVPNSRRMSCPSHVGMSYSNSLEIPITFGILRPQIVVPMQATCWCDDQFRMVVKHELAHVERRDVFWQLIFSILKCMYWFQPLLWWVSRDVALAREQACDDRVIADGEDQADYATTLVQVAALTSGRTSFYAGALSMSQKPIVKRIDSILSNDVSRSATNRWLTWCAASMALFLSAGVCSVRPFQAHPATAQMVRPADGDGTELRAQEKKQEGWIHRFGQERPKTYQVSAKDVLGIYIEGVLGDARSLPPMILPLPQPGGVQNPPPSIGFPIPVRANGSITLPLVDPINIDGLTIAQVEARIIEAYRGGEQPIIDDKARIIVTLLKSRTYRVFVVRSDAKKQRGYVLNLPAYQNDVLNALMATGGIPVKAKETEIGVVHTDNTADNLVRDFHVAEFYERHKPQTFPIEFIPSVKQAVEAGQVSVRIALGEGGALERDDVLLQDGDIVFVHSDSK